MKMHPLCQALLLALPALLPVQAETPELRLAQLEREIEREVERSVERGLAPLAFAFGDGALGFAGRELENERVVKGAPYCATAVHENLRQLADGNRIVKRQSTQLCRDGEGRTRRELQREGGSTVVYLHDPVAKESWVLDPERKTARRLRGTVMSWHGNAAERVEQAEQHSQLAERMREQAERWREWAGQVARQARDGEQAARKAGVDARRAAEQAAKGEPGVVVERELLIREPGASEPTRQREVRVIRLSDMPAMAPLPPMPPMPPVLPRGPMPGGELHLGFFMPRGDAVTTALPAKEIEGVKVNGERSSWTIPAGKIGNEKPIVISREVWRSPELMLTVASKDSDPRSGEVSYRLEKIKRGEPDPALMKPPADYQVQERGTPRAPKAPAAPRPPAAPGKA